MKTTGWLKENRLALLLGCLAVVAEMFLVGLYPLSAPAGQRWLGDTIAFPGDAAVYLSYLKQGSEGHILLDNLYAVEPHAKRFDGFWSTLGLAARTGIPPLAVFEIARWIMTLLLVFVLFRAAQATLQDKRESGFVTLLMLMGVGLGWTYTFIVYSQGHWDMNTPLAADIGSEFSAAVIFLSGPHIILSLALLAAAMRLTWIAFQGQTSRISWMAAVAWALLLSFHPYYGPFMAVYLALAVCFSPEKKLRRRLVPALIIALAVLPAAVIYLPLLTDKIFSTHHLKTNQLPLAPAASWLLTLAPFALAAAWRWKRKIGVRPEEKWLVAWLAASVVCIILPLPWKRKYTEGLGPALILLTAPFWLYVRDKFARGTKGFWRFSSIGLLCLGLGLGSLSVVATQLAWLKNVDGAKWFYRPAELFSAWHHLNGLPDQTVCLSDDIWVNVWTPAYAGKTVWVAHDHETPDFKTKVEIWKRLLKTDEPDEARAILGDAGITDFITTSASSTERFKRLLGDGWKVSFQHGQYNVFHKD
ncbi:MAG: hypothetical protein WC551_07095 [Patescibacteria group bacterium]